MTLSKLLDQPRFFGQGACGQSFTLHQRRYDHGGVKVLKLIGFVIGLDTTPVFCQRILVTQKRKVEFVPVIHP